MSVEPIKSTLVKLALVKFESSKFPPVKVDSYKFIKDSLTKVLSKRIVEAKKQPKGLDFVTDNPQEWREPREVYSQPK